MQRLNGGAILITLGLFLFLALTSATGGKHTVVPGDTLWQIAYVHRVPVAELVAANQLPNPELIVPGQVLRIPPSAEPQTPPPAAGNSILHLVRPGETLSEIALRYGVAV